MAQILFHTLVFSPDGVSTAYLVTDLAKQLKYLGHSIIVLTTTPHYNLDQKALDRQSLQERWMGLLYQSDYDGIKVWHVKVPMKGKRVYSRVFDFFYYHLFSLILGFTVIEDYDIVITPSPPLTIGIVGWLLSKRKHVPFVYNLQEIYPDFAINQGLIRNRLIIKVLRLIEKFIYSHSQKVVTISEKFNEILRERGVQNYKITTIPNFVDIEMYRPLPRKNPFSEQHNLVDDFVVLYGGNIGLSQDWEAFLFAARTLSHLPIKFVVVGDGAYSEWLRNEVERQELQNVKILGYQSRNLMPQINASSDVCIIPMKNSSTRDTFPSKIYTILACGKPVIVQADADSELACLIREAQCGRAVPPHDPQAYADAIHEAFQEKERLSEEGLRGRLFIENRYSKEVIGRQYDELIRELTGS